MKLEKMKKKLITKENKDFGQGHIFKIETNQENIIVGAKEVHIFVFLFFSDEIFRFKPISGGNSRSHTIYYIFIEWRNFYRCHRQILPKNFLTIEICRNEN